MGVAALPLLIRPGEATDLDVLIAIDGTNTNSSDAGARTPQSGS